MADVTLKGLLGEFKNYLRDASPGGLLNPEITPERAKNALEYVSMTPTPFGDAASGLLAGNYLMKGQFGNAGLEAVGLLPFVPGMIKKADIGYLRKKGVDVLGRDIPDWADAKLVHFTDKDAARKIAAEGYLPGSGYYGEAISFTPDWKYASQFGDTGTVAKVSPKAKILNLNDPADFDKFTSVQNAMRNNPAWYRNNDYRSAMRSMGYDGLYDPGAGDLFIYRPSAVQYLDVLEK